MLIVRQIPVCIMLDNESRWIKPRNRKSVSKDPKYSRSLPVVEDLATHDMPTHSPAVSIALLSQPVMPEQLSTEIMRLER